MYCAKMYNWFVRLGLMYEKDRKAFLRTTKASDITLEFNAVTPQEGPD